MCVTAVTTSPGQHWVPLYTADSPPLTCDVTIWFPTTFSARHGLGPGSKPTIDIVTGNNPLKGRATRLVHTADSPPHTRPTDWEATYHLPPASDDINSGKDGSDWPESMLECGGDLAWRNGWMPRQPRGDSLMFDYIQLFFYFLIYDLYWRSHRHDIKWEPQISKNYQNPPTNKTFRKKNAISSY